MISLSHSVTNPKRSSHQKIAADVFTIFVFIVIGVSGITYSFSHNFPAVRIFFAYPLCAICNIFLIWRGTQNKISINNSAPPFMQNLLLVILLWGGTLIFRSLDMTLTRTRDLFFTNWGALTFLLPLLSYYGLSLNFWPKFFRFGLLLLKTGILFIGINDLFFLLTSKELVPLTPTVLFLAPLIFLCGFHSSKNLIKIGAIGLSIWLISAFFDDRREDMVLILYYFSCCLFEIRHSRYFKLKEKTQLFLAIGIIFSSISLFGVQSLYQKITTNSLENRIQQFYVEKGMTRNSREGLVNDFFKYRSFKENVFGGGAVTSYRTDILHIEQSHLGGGRRTHIEIGHLYHTLTGGLILNILFNFTIFGAIYLGIFRSKNRFTNILSYLLLGWWAMMFTAATPLGGARYALIWLMIGGCCSKEIRATPTKDFMLTIQNITLRRRKKIKW